MKEQTVLHRILLACSHGTRRLFRVNTGTAWAGKTVQRITKGGSVNVNPGDVVIRAAQPIRMGLCNGGSDLIGWQSHVVTQEDVGRTLAVFAAVEVKNEKGRLRPEQQKFIDMVRSIGGIAGMARSPEEALTIMSTLDTLDTHTGEF